MGDTLLKQARYYVIYSFDVVKDQSVGEFKPHNIKLWQLTETDEWYDFDYLKGEYENGKHRKYVADLSYNQFKAFIDDANIYAEEVETMGSLTERGHLPAISFNGENDAISQNAYVTPYIENQILNNNDFDNFKEAILNIWGI